MNIQKLSLSCRQNNNAVTVFLVLLMFKYDVVNSLFTVCFFIQLATKNFGLT